MDVLKAGAKYEFNFGGLDFSQGVKVFAINYSETIEGQASNLLENVSLDKLPTLRSKNDFIELLAVLKVSNSLAEVEAGKFTCHSFANLNGDRLSSFATFTIGIEKAMGVWQKFKIYSTGKLPEAIIDDPE